MEMEQLVSMGFSRELAAEALAATGGTSTLQATEWILSHKSSAEAAAAAAKPNQNPSSNTAQPKLDRFFQSQSKSNSSSISPTKVTARKRQQEEEQSVDHKRPKLVASTATTSNSPRHLHRVPLSERMRPVTVDDVVGQDHLLGPNSILRSAIDCNRLPSIILWGPPGTGKTSLAKAIINSSSYSYRFVSLSAVTCGVKDVRDAVDSARKLTSKLNNNNPVHDGRGRTTTVLFVDEIHRFNKSQQDSFLPVIDDGTIVFVGATTENPSFHLITPLLSRCTLLTLSPLKPHHVHAILNRAIHHSDRSRGLPASLPLGVRVEVSEDAIHFLSHHCDGDARVALNALEISATAAAARSAHDNSFPVVNVASDDPKEEGQQFHDNSFTVANVTLDDAKEALQSKHLVYDKAGEQHYNLISALHKSMRGSDADASIYWLARMLEGGEQPLYIARRLIRFASEDVGLADPFALNQAVACYQACHFLGMPESNVILAQCVAYLALAPKSISVYRAIETATKVVQDLVGQNEGVPLHLRNAPTRLMKDLGYGKGYIYTPDDPSSKQTYLPSSLQGYRFLDWPPSNSSDGQGTI